MLKLFITDLAAYNSGYLIGKWITLPLSNQELSHAIWEVLQEGEDACKSDSNHEEIFITDYEWEEGIDIIMVDEYANVYHLNDDVTKLLDLNKIQQKAVAFLLQGNFTYDFEDAIARADDVIIHENQSMEDVAYDLLQECYGVDTLPSIIANHIDYKGVARDLECDGTYFELDGDVFEYVG